ncbi:molybdopterin-guanine dinucleotide biosynthesis protein B [Amylibacter kogurei]|uniref:Molybdopterin-guanine dinucleotide biosynthesis protein B n=1 Tax=Paramylibacter kogurei TaxID=1889778 RepID=A0A2G5K0Z7_9RHOB|nr:molybdopterin-guanine dinucleotide biosynthesis protein B [Amylibacter kogurei]PIB23218.1 molybdopterin-guanine dinucleotide biosynthesis protein B [Amylibacter kogurei]
MKIFGVVGWKNSGKTGLVERLVTEISARGFSVSTVKHAHHDFDVDQPGRDSFRHRAAGAEQVMLASANRWALMTELRDAPEPSLDDLLAQMSPVDLVLVEGFKTETHQKLECHRVVNEKQLLAQTDPAICLIASDGDQVLLNKKTLHLDDTNAIADFVLTQVGLK